MKTSLILLFSLFIHGCFAQEPTIPPPPAAIVVEEEIIDKKKPDAKGVFSFPDVEAEFKGGPEAMKRFLQNNLHYPTAAIEKNEQGKVFISFVVDEKGRIGDIKVERGVSKTLDAEALRVIKLMPKWKPGKMGRKKVKTRVRLPIYFNLN